MSEIRSAVLVTLLFAVASCKPGGLAPNAGDPKRQLTDYISRTFAIQAVEDKQTLLKYMTGDARSRLSAWSDEQFRQAFIESKRQFVKLNIAETKTVNPQEVSITYELTYLDQGKGHDAKVTNKKLATLVREGGNDVWLIKSVHNIKELVEYRNEMSLP